jgi:glycosyltransferase involved in cell wall biosynthesis
MVWMGFGALARFNGVQGWIRKLITYFALRGFDLVVCHAKPLVESLHLHYPWASGKLAYVRRSEGKPGQTYQVADEGYVFCGGRTNRDFESVLTVVRELNVPAKLVMGANVKLRGEVPKSVEIYRDIPAQQFYNLMSRARVVVIALDRPEIASGHVVLNQAMRLGKAVVVTDTAGIDDYVSDGHNALLVKPNDPGDLRDKLALLLADPNLRNTIGKNGSALLSEHNLYTYTKDLTRLITQLG